MYENEEQSDIIGKSCTLLNPYKGYTEGTIVGDYGNRMLNPYKGYTEGTIVGDYGNRIIVCLTSGKEVSEYRDEVIIHE